MLALNLIELGRCGLVLPEFQKFEGVIVNSIHGTFHVDGLFLISGRAPAQHT
jgi:hypothetical protein